jgi:hypothetical protein
MTSKIKVDNINKVSDDSNIIKKCGTTTTIGSGASNPIVVDGSAVTLGRCGGTVALASGATQTGFGRTGTVDWQTTPKTATFTAVSGEGYFVNTTAGVVTMNLPSSPSAGAIVAVSDYANTFATNNLTIGRNGSLINGGAFDFTSATNGIALTFVYVDGTRGWKNVNDATTNASGLSNFVTATVSGSCNTIVTSGNFKTAIFKGPGTFCVSGAGNACGSNTVDYFIVAGGGGSSDGNGAYGGGGAGGFRISNSVGCLPAPSMSPLTNPTGLPVSVQGYPITVGGGGANRPGPGFSGNQTGNPGSVSTFSSITSAVGGGGANTGPGAAGGSGGGGSQGPTPTSGYPGGAGNTPPVSPPQGNAGGAGYDGLAATNNGGGGGGASAVGTNSGPGSGGSGGAGSFIACAMVGPTAPSYGTPGPSTGRWFAGGGAGHSYPGSPGSGGAGGGGDYTCNGATNTGGGSGPGPTAGNGGSGIVMIRYKFQ